VRDLEVDRRVADPHLVAGGIAGRSEPAAPDVAVAVGQAVVVTGDQRDAGRAGRHVRGDGVARRVAVGAGERDAEVASEVIARRSEPLAEDLGFVVGREPVASPDHEVLAGPRIPGHVGLTPLRVAPAVSMFETRMSPPRSPPSAESRWPNTSSWLDDRSPRPNQTTMYSFVAAS
jgi:hypothetical protein